MRPHERSRRRRDESSTQDTQVQIPRHRQSPSPRSVGKRAATRIIGVTPPIDAIRRRARVIMAMPGRCEFFGFRRHLPLPQPPRTACRPRSRPPRPRHARHRSALPHPVLPPSCIRPRRRASAAVSRAMPRASSRRKCINLCSHPFFLPPEMPSLQKAAEE